MSKTLDDTVSDVHDDTQGAFFELPPLAGLEPYGGAYANTGQPKTLRTQCVECNRRFVRLGALRCDGCLKATVGSGVD